VGGGWRCFRGRRASACGAGKMRVLVNKTSLDQRVTTKARACPVHVHVTNEPQTTEPVKGFTAATFYHQPRSKCGNRRGGW